jgi:hypothetical protein
LQSFEYQNITPFKAIELQNLGCVAVITVVTVETEKERKGG